MSKRDAFHPTVRQALIADGWTITHDPYSLPFGSTNVYIDLGAETPIGAERDDKKIAVEVKSFSGLSAVSDLEDAIGQFVFYRVLLKRDDPERVMFLAVPAETYNGIFRESDTQDLLIPELQLRILVVDETTETISKWIEP